MTTYHLTQPNEAIVVQPPCRAGKPSPLGTREGNPRRARNSSSKTSHGVSSKNDAITRTPIVRRGEEAIAALAWMEKIEGETQAQGMRGVRYPLPKKPVIAGGSQRMAGKHSSEEDWRRIGFRWEAGL